MDIRLIRANIALAEDDRLEVLRLLEEYLHASDKTDDHEALMLWLEAHAQTDHNALIRHLEKLLKQTPPYDVYHQMAHDYLWKEDTYNDTLADVRHQTRAVPGMTRKRIIGGAVGVIASLMLVILLIRWTARPTADVVIPTLAVLPTTAFPTLMPDTSQALNINDHLARYEGGLLMVAALEDNSIRVVDSISLEPLQPVDGARFYALQLHFECRQGICSEPPQAALSLILDNDLSVPPREGAMVQNAEVMTPIALGRRTVGWVVFEVPLVSSVKELLVTPTDMVGRENPLIIELPSTIAP
jgi:hypothetical protein